MDEDKADEDNHCGEFCIESVDVISIGKGMFQTLGARRGGEVEVQTTDICWVRNVDIC